MENNSQKFIVYLTINTNNKKRYVGVHGTSTPDKFDGYLGNGAWVQSPSTYNKGLYPLHAAILKYGVKSFKRFTLKVFDKLEDALDLERWIVTEEFIKRTDTYNCTLGGGLPPLHNKVIYQFDLNGNLVKEWKSGSDINRYYNSSVQFYDIITKKRSFAGYFWSFDKSIDVSSYKKELNHGFINQYTLDGTLLNQFATTTIAAQKLDLSRDNITQAVFRKKPYAGYYFLKADVNISEVLSNVYKPKLGKTHIYKYDSKSGDLLSEYETITLAKKENDGLTQYKLKDSLVNGKINCDAYWSYIKSDNYFNIENPCEKPVIKIVQYSKNGDLIKIWDSPKECKKQYPGALRCCQGYLKSTKGYVFKYSEN